MGNCLFIPSEGKIENRNPCLLPGVEFTEALGASFTHSIPPSLLSSRNVKKKKKKKCYSRNPADSCIASTQAHTQIEESDTYTHTITPHEFIVKATYSFKSSRILLAST